MDALVDALVGAFVDAAMDAPTDAPAAAVFDPLRGFAGGTAARLVWLMASPYNLLIDDAHPSAPEQGRRD